MKLEDIKALTLTNVKTEGKAIVEAHVEGVYAVEILQAEGRAEKFLDMVAKDNGEVVSCDRWECLKKGDGMAETWTIRFFCA